MQHAQGQERLNRGIGPLLSRMFRAALLDKHLYKEVAADRGSMGQALLVVVLVAVATGIGLFDEGGLTRARALPAQIVLGLVGWVVWASITYLAGAKLLGTSETHASWSTVARALGFAQAPGVLRVLGILPELGILISLVTVVWQLVAMVVAIRQALDYRSHWRALGVISIGLIPYLFIVGGFNLLVEVS